MRQKSYYESLQTCNRPQQCYLLFGRKAIHNTLNILLCIIKSWLLGKMKTPVKQEAYYRNINFLLHII